MKTLECRDMGVDCNFKATGQTKEEVMQKAGEHAAAEHGMTDMSPEMMAKVAAAVKDAA
jgi:predicted small metal-binding protein